MAEARPGPFGRIAATMMRRPKMWAWLVLCSWVLAVLLASRLQVDSNILELLPPGDPTTQAIRQLNDEEGGSNLLLIAVEPMAPDASEAQARTDAYMRSLIERFEAWPDVEFALYAIDSQLAWRVGLMQLKPDELRTIRDRVRGAIALGPAAANPFVAGRLLDLGPLTQKISSSNQSPAVGSSDGIARLLVRPTGSAYDPSFSRPFMHRVYELLEELDPEDHGQRLVWIGGAFRHSVEDLEGIIHDMRWTAIISLSLVVILVGGAFRDPRAVFLIFVPLVVGTTWTAGYASIAVGTINTFTSFSAAVLIGLGVDFSIHLYSRYREERLRSDSLRDAVVRAWDRAGPPCLTAALTSAGGFCALWVAGFEGFRQLGTILAGGVLLCLVAVLTTLPLLIVWREQQPRTVPLRELRLPERTHPPTYRLAPLGLLLIILVTVANAFLLPRVGFEYDLSELRRSGMAYSELDEGERAVARDAFAPVVVSFPDAESLATNHVRLAEAMEAGETPWFGRILSLYTVIPVDQEERVSLLREIAELARDPNVRFLPAPVQSNLARIADSDPSPLTADDLPLGLRGLLGATAGHHRLTIIPDGNMWDLRNDVALHEEVEKWLPGYPAAGEFLASAVLYRLMQGDAPRVAGVALLAVFVLALIDLRKPLRALGAVAALVAGMCWAGAGLVFFQIKISLVNFVGIPILMGIGVDVVIHLLHRLDEEGPGRIRWALATTGWAAGLSALTTVVSFASLSIASNQGVRSLGMMIVMGLTMVTILAFVVVPLGWQTMWKIRGELPKTWPPPGK